MLDIPHEPQERLRVGMNHTTNIREYTQSPGKLESAGLLSGGMPGGQHKSNN